jgi:hypothetical protein
MTPMRQKIIDEVRLMMGGQMVDIELDPEHYHTALTLAFDRYRQRSGNSSEEAYLFLNLLYEQSDYYLPDEVVSVRTIFRRGMGSTSGGTELDPFALAYTNLYLLQAGAGGGYSAGLVTFELFNQYLRQAGRMFGRDINYTFDTVTKKLSIIRKPTGGESVLLWVYKFRADEAILQDPFARPWIRDYTLAWCKQMLGEAYSKFQTVIGPQGGTTMKGDALKNEAKEILDRLEKELVEYVDGSMPLGIVIG